MTRYDDRGVTVGTVGLGELPGRNQRKGDTLMSLPEVQDAIKRVRAGIDPGMAVYMKLSAEKMSHLKITTPSRILLEKLKTLIAQEGIKTKAGTAPDVYKYRATDGDEVVFVSDVQPRIRRSSSIARTERRRRGGR